MLYKKKSCVKSCQKHCLLKNKPIVFQKKTIFFQHVHFFIPLFWNDYHWTMPIKTNLLLNYQYQRKNGTNKCTKHHLQENHIKSHYLLIKQQVGKTQITSFCIEIWTNFKCIIYLKPRFYIKISNTTHLCYVICINRINFKAQTVMGLAQRLKNGSNANAIRNYYSHSEEKHRNILS